MKKFSFINGIKKTYFITVFKFFINKFKCENKKYKYKKFNNYYLFFIINDKIIILFEFHLY